MQYAQASRQMLARALTQQRDSVPVGSLLVAHAADVLDSGKLTLNQFQIAYGGKNITGADQLAPILTVPGVKLMTPVFNSDGNSGTVPTSTQDDPILDNFTAAQVAGSIGSYNVEFLDVIRSLWEDRVSQLGALTEYQHGRVLLLLNAGILVVPASAANLGNLGYPVELRTVAPQFQAAWDMVVAAFKAALDQYNAKNFQAAIDSGRAASRNEAVWDAIYAAVEYAHDLPQHVAEAAVSGVGAVAGALGWKSWLIVGSVIVVILLVRALPGAALSYASARE